MNVYYSLQKSFINNYKNIHYPLNYNIETYGNAGNSNGNQNPRSNKMVYFLLAIGIYYSIKRK
jgi:hypothetical protein